MTSRKTSLTFSDIITLHYFPLYLLSSLLIALISLMHWHVLNPTPSPSLMVSSLGKRTVSYWPWHTKDLVVEHLLRILWSWEHLLSTYCAQNHILSMKRTEDTVLPRGTHHFPMISPGGGGMEHISMATYHFWHIACVKDLHSRCLKSRHCLIK